MNRIQERERIVCDAEAGRMGLKRLWDELQRTWGRLTSAERDVDQYNASAELERRTRIAQDESF